MKPTPAHPSRRCAFASALAVAGALAVAAPARAFVYLECDDRALHFQSDPIQLRMSSVSFPSSSSFTWALASAVAGINLNPSKATLLLVAGDDSIGLDNGQNETAFTDDASLVEGTYGVTFRTYDCGAGAIEEADVLFNASHSWTASSQKQWQKLYGGSGVPFGAIADHELGHLLGLQHETRVYTIMLGWGHEHANGAYADAYIGEDASDGLVFLYGLDPARRQDVAAAHWRIIESEVLGVMGMFRTAVYDHAPPHYVPFTEMLDTVDGFVAWRDTTSEPRFIVYSGQTVYPDFTYENDGADTQTVNAAYYLSPDATVSTADRRIGTFSLTLSRGWPLTHAQPVTLPPDLAEGSEYQLGVIVDHDGRIAESLNEGNNASYVGVRIGQTHPMALAFEPSHVMAGERTTGWLTLRGAAPAGGVAITLATAAPYLTVPASILVPAGNRFASFEVSTNAAYPAIGSQEAVVTALRPGVAGLAQGSVVVKFGDVPPQSATDTNCALEPSSPMCSLCQTAKISLCDWIVVDPRDPPVLPPVVPPGPTPGPPPPWVGPGSTPWWAGGTGPSDRTF
jgi:hypothetical protein